MQMMPNTILDFLAYVTGFMTADNIIIETESLGKSYFEIILHCCHLISIANHDQMK